jgi:hypothetical protein
LIEIGKQLPRQTCEHKYAACHGSCVKAIARVNTSPIDSGQWVDRRIVGKSRWIQVEHGHRFGLAPDIQGVGLQSLDSQGSRLFGSIGVDFNAIAMSGCAMQQVSERRSISRARIECRELRYGGNAMLQPSGFGHGQREESQLGLSMWSHFAIPLSASATRALTPSESGIPLTAKTEHRPFTGIGPFIFNAVAALDMLLFSFLKQVGSGGHTNPHGDPHFTTIGNRWKSASGGSWNAGTNLGVCAKPFGDSDLLPLARFLSLAQTFPNGSKICGGVVPRHRAQK